MLFIEGAASAAPFAFRLGVDPLMELDSVRRGRKIRMMWKGCASSKPQCVMNAGDLLRSGAGRHFLRIKGMKAAFLFFWRGFVIFLSSTVTFLSFQTVVEKFYKMF